MFDTEPSPTESQSSHEPERNPLGWIILAAMFGLLFIVNLESYLKRDIKPQAQAAHYEKVLKTYVKAKDVTESLGAPVAREDRELDDALKSLSKLKEVDRDAAMLYAAMRYERALSVPPEVCKFILQGKTQENKAFGEIYVHEGLTPADVARITPELNTRKFLDRLALAHAKQKAGMPKSRVGLVTPPEKRAILAVGMLVMSVLFFGLVALLFIVMYSMSNPLPGHPTGKITTVQADKLALYAACAMVIFIVFSELGRIALKSAPLPVKVAIPALAVIVGIAYLFKWPLFGQEREGETAQTGLAEIGVKKGKTLELIGWGLLGAIANAPIVLAMALLGQALSKGLPPPEHPIELELMQNPSLLTILAILFTASVQAPFFEEILFRGTLLPALAKVLKSPVWAGVLSSCLFAVIHPTGIPAWPALAAIGGMSAFLTYRTSSLVPSMVMHGVHNFATLLLALAIS